MEEEKNYTGRKIENITTSNFDGEKWTVHLSITHYRKAEDSDEWESKTIEAMATDKEEENAYSDVATQMLNLLESCGGDVFGEEFSTDSDTDLLNAGSSLVN